jgi:hypothetical protein
VTRAKANWLEEGKFPMTVWFRSWHFSCTCFWMMQQADVIAQTKRHYLVADRARGNGHPRVKRIAKWRCVVQP